MARGIRRIVIVAPMRSHTQTVRAIFENGPIDTYLRGQFGERLNELAKLEKTFGIVAGTGVGKTVFLRDICEYHFGKLFSFSVVTKEEEATKETWESDVLIVTSGIAMHYLRAGYIDSRDAIIIDEIHQTSEHLELAMALAKYRKVAVSWMSATINTEVYQQYFNTEEILVCENRDPDKRANVSEIRFAAGRSRYSSVDAIVAQKPWIEHYLNDMGNLRRVIMEERGCAVFLPTRAMCEKYARDFKRDGLHSDFYHGGESASKLRAYLRGEIAKPFILFMTAAGSSSLNVQGLDWVIIHDEMYTEVVNRYSGVKALERIELGPNELLQMAGRVDGRVSGGEVTILTQRQIDYQSLTPVTPEFVLAGDLEQVALTCARLRIKLDELDPIGGIDHYQYQRARELLIERGLIAADDSLTEYGEKVGRFPVARVWAEHLAQTEDEMLPFLVVVSACPSLYSMLNREGSYDIKEFIVPDNDFLTKYRIVQYVIDYFTYVWVDEATDEQSFRLRTDFFDWAKAKGIYAKTIKEILISIAAICRALNVDLKQVHSQFPDVDDEVTRKFKELVVKVNGLSLVNCFGALKDGRPVRLAKASMCAGSEMRAPLFGTISTFRHLRFGEIMNIEGVRVEFDDVAAGIDAHSRRVVNVSTGENLKIVYEYSGFGFSDFIRQEVEYDELPDDEEHRLQHRPAAEAFASFLAYATIEDLGADVWAANHAVITRVMEQRRRVGHFEGFPEFARSCYQKHLADSGIYSLAMARKRGFSLKLNPAEHLTSEARPSVSVERRERPRRSGFSWGIYPEPAAGDEIFPPPRRMKSGAPRKDEGKKSGISTVTESRSQARVDWLTDQAERLRAEIRALECEYDESQKAADEAGRKYDEAYKSRQRNVLDLQCAWADAVKAGQAKEQALAQKRKEFKPRIIALENEALEIMAELEG